MFSTAPLVLSRMVLVFAIGSEMSRGRALAMVSPFLNLGASGDPNEISTYLSPNKPSGLMDATESFLRTSLVARYMSITTVTFSSAVSVIQCA